jgi:hypothetical protein
MNDFESSPPFYPAPPPGGGYLVLSESQIGNFDLLCAIKTIYPNTRIIPQQMIPTSSDLGREQL